MKGFLLLLLSYSVLAFDTLWIPITIPMRDGKSLAGDFYTIDSASVKPVVLIQTPYNKATYRVPSLFLDVSDTSGFWNIQSYHFVILDWRGFYASASAESSGYDRGLDGYDAVEWIASRPWCDGNIGTYGGSALGDIQFKTAKHKPPHLVCCVPYIRDYKTKYSDYYYGGDYRKQHVEAMSGLGFLTPAVVLAYPTYGPVWMSIENNSDYPESIEVPILMASGWFDHYPGDCLRAFRDLRERSHPAVRNLHRMIMGPWTHMGVDKANQGELTFSGAEDFFDDYVKLFFDRFLRGADNDYEGTPVIQFFQMGEDIWFSTEDWFALGDRRDTLYLSLSGGLSDLPPAAPSGYDSLFYDPRDPSPSYGGACFNPLDTTVVVGPVDISDTIESRGDVLIYSTGVLADDLRIDGGLRVELFISSNRLDTDFAVRLCDVYPDGRSIILTDGIRRARFRNGFTTGELLSPGTVYSVPVELQELAHTFISGHRLRIVLSSSDYPRFDINLNNGGAMYVAGDTLAAVNRVYTNSIYPSRLIYTQSSLLNAGEGISQRPADFGITVFPNPFNSAVSISAPSGAEIGIFDVNGRLIAQLPAGGSGGAGFTPARNDGAHDNERDGARQSEATNVFIWTPDETIPSGVYLVRASSDGRGGLAPVGEPDSGRFVAKRIVYLK